MEEGSSSIPDVKRLKRIIDDILAKGNNVGVSTQTISKKDCNIFMNLSDLEMFDCSVCMEVLSPPVFQCQNGHVLCSGCCTAVKNQCPSCRMHVGSIRCLFVEKILEVMIFACKYKQYGCTETLSCAEKSEHEETCVFVPFTCPVSYCNFRFPLTQLLLHVGKDHLFSVTRFSYNTIFTVVLSKLDKYVVLQQGGVQAREKGPIFILSNQVSPRHSDISLVCLGSKSDDHGRFKYELLSTKEERTYILKGVMECVQKQSEASLVADALRIPNDFYSSEDFAVQIRIYEIKQ